ncbi:uroporphyrinogen decarboxylase [Caldanaerobius fijiensis DSM 17918]|uniref:Uroporphyrinogen decarboxylase n=2 Tax=Caldanaerobius TaxID=862261 RepID=A0A1M4Y3P1_9THEO|nr:uroporphyrinogen decarboxylase [Caldanaerobius fijiensis DSM 17918]
MNDFIPDYMNIVNAAKNRRTARMPLYEHIISESIMEQVLNKKFADLYNGDLEDRKEFFRNYVEFFKRMEYDTVSFERCIGPAMPGSGALGGHKPGVIKTREDFEKYPWDSIPQRYFQMYDEDFRLLGEVMPEGMKAIGGPGNGVFELMQDIVGYMDLCYISVDDPQLYRDLFAKVGDVMYKIWNIFLQKYGEIYAVCRFGDDLGFKTNTLISAEDIRENVIPQYARIVELVHLYGKPFLLHSCGNIFSVMDDIINIAKIDAKHSNEDQIAPFSVWVDKYGQRIGNFGGVDTDVLCRMPEAEIKEYVREVIKYATEKKKNAGFALGSGNSIPDYVPVYGYLAMVEAAREMRGENVL